MLSLWVGCWHGQDSIIVSPNSALYKHGTMVVESEIVETISLNHVQTFLSTSIQCMIKTIFKVKKRKFHYISFGFNFCNILQESWMIDSLSQRLTNQRNETRKSYPLISKQELIINIHSKSTKCSGFLQLSVFWFLLLFLDLSNLAIEVGDKTPER